MIARVYAWSEEIADGELIHYIERQDEDDSTVGATYEYDTASSAYKAASRVAAKHKAELITEDLIWDGDDYPEVTRWTDHSDLWEGE